VKTVRFVQLQLQLLPLADNLPIHRSWRTLLSDQIIEISSLRAEMAVGCDHFEHVDERISSSAVSQSPAINRAKIIERMKNAN
jgi:hypothetical protein